MDSCRVKVLFLSMDSVGEGLAWAVRAAKAGHQVKLWLAPECNQTVGEGFKGIERVDNWLAHAKWSDILIPTGNHQFVKKFDMLRKNGIKVFGPSEKSTELEIDRAVGMKIFEDHHIEIPKWKSFPTLAAAEAHVRQTEERFVFKCMGDAGDKSLSYCSKSPADMVARLQRWQRLKLDPKGPVLLQQFIAGIEFAVSRWMGTDGFIGQYNENFETKKLLSGNHGPNCGESGTLCKYVEDSAIAEKVLAPLEKELVKLGHIGDVDVNCIVSEDGTPYPLEWTARAGWPSTNILLASHKGDPIEWAYDACEGKDTLLTSPAVACGIVVAMPDYPYSTLTKAETDGVPLYGVTKENQKYISPQAIKITKMPTMDAGKLIEADIWTTAGDYLAVVTGHGKTVKRACERAYATIDDLHVPDMIIRDDIGESLQHSLPELQRHGFATDWAYG